MRGVMFTIGASLAVVVAAQSFAQQPAQAVPADLVQNLKRGDPAAKMRAADALGDHGAAAKDAVPALIAALKDIDPDVRWHVERALGSIGPDAAPAVSALAELLVDKDAKVRAYAAFALGRIGEASKPVAPALVAAIKDSEQLVRREAIKALGQIRPGPAVSVPLFAEVMKSAQPSEIIPALHTLAEFGEQVVPALIEGLKNEHARYWVCLVLAEIGPKAKDAVPGLIEVLSDTNPELQREATLALGKIGPDAGSASPALAKLLDDKLPGVRHSAAWALGAIGPAARAALPAIEAHVNSDDVLMKTLAAWSAARMDPNNLNYRERAVPLLISAIKSDEPRIRAAALNGLADLKLNDPSVTQTFIKSLADSDDRVSSVAMRALVDLGTGAVAPLTQALADDHMRGYAAAVLGRLGSTAKSALLPLAAGLKDKQPAVRAEILSSLALVAPDDPHVLATLVRFLEGDADPAVRQQAAVSMGQLGPAAASAIPALQKATQDTDPNVRVAAAEALPYVQAK